MKGWRDTTMGELLKIQHGFAFKGEHFSDSGDLIVLTPGNFHEAGGFRARPDKDRFYRGQFPDRYLLDRNDLIVAMTEQGEGLLGSSALIPESGKYLHNQRIGLVHPRKSSVAKIFLYHLFNTDHVRQQIRNSSSGAKIRHTSPERIYRTKVRVPDRECQLRIAGILTTYDGLIENYKQCIALLEKLAEELYREWFVRYRFPGYRKAEFIKGIPANWRIKPFGEIANFRMGQSPPSSSYNTAGDGLPFHQGVGTFGARFPLTVTYCNAKGRMAQKGDILFSVRAPVGRINLADSEMIIGRGVAAIRHKQGCNSYLFYLLKSVFADEDIIGNGSIFNAVGKDELAKFKILESEKDLILKFQAATSSIDQQIESLSQSVVNLTKSRDMLLPRLMSGKLSVENLEIQFPLGIADELDAASPVAAHA
jgi:type I restriction enzyme S subunit